MICWSRRGLLVLLCKIFRSIYPVLCQEMRRWQFLVQLGENTTLVGSVLAEHKPVFMQLRI